MAGKDKKEEKDVQDAVTKVTSREAYLEVTRVRLTAGKVDDEEAVTEKLEVKPFLTEVATVSVKAGATINLGNYESARVDVMLSIPCYIEEIDSVYEQAKDWVDTRVSKKYKELKEGV